MHATPSSLRRHAGLIAGLILCGSSPFAGAAVKEADAFPQFDSYIKVSGQAPNVTGNPAAYAKRFRNPENGSYGIEELYLARDLSKDVALEVDGRALTGAEDYLGKFKLTKNEVGTVEVGYKRFRTFYDGIGGFFPLNKAWMPLGTEELHTDRAKFWTDITIALPDKPVFNLKYTNELRNGRKDSTIWGDSDLTGIPIYNVSSLNPISANKKIVPSILQLDERQKTFEASVRHTVGNTDLSFEVVNTKTDSNDTRWMNRYPGELKPYPLYSTGQPAFLVAGNRANNFTTGYDTQMTDADVWTYTGKFETRVTDQLTVFGGLSYQDASADIGGDRQMTLYIATGKGIVNAVGGFVGASGRPPYSYKTTAGGTEETVLTGNIGATYKPQKDFQVTLALKGEDLSMDGHNHVTYMSNSIVQATGVVTPVNVAAANTASRDEKSWVPELDVRYSGIKGVALYSTIDYRYSPGDEVGSSGGVGTGGIASTPVTSFDNVKLNHGHYKVGVNWTVNPMVTIRAETFYKDHLNKYTGYGTSLGGRYILGYEFKGYKLTTIVKPLPTVTVTGRYVGQIGKMHTQADDDEEYDSMDAKNHMFGGTVDWNPNKTVYFQANLNVVFNTLQTAYPRAGGAANDVLRNSDNDYVSGNLIAGFAVDKATDATLEYSYYKADNYDPLAPKASIAYGAGAKEYTVTAGIKRKLTDRMILNAKAGYFDSKSDTTGGNTNFRGPLFYVALDYAL
ncbi:MAG TPA: hypothetical protein VIM71_07675 [Lacunisphaera sp.]